jgi:hypothetical protein
LFVLSGDGSVNITIFAVTTRPLRSWESSENRRISGAVRHHTLRRQELRTLQVKDLRHDRRGAHPGEEHAGNLHSELDRQKAPALTLVTNRGFCSQRPF